MALAGFVHVVLISTAVQLVLVPNRVYSYDPDSYSLVPRLGSLVPQISANPLAFIAVAGLMSLVTHATPGWVRRDTFLRALLLVVYTAELALTRTRSALVIGLLVLAVTAVARIRRTPVPALLLVTTGMVVALLLRGTEVMTYLLRGQTEQGISTLTGRTVIWQMALDSSERHRLFGLGYYSGHRLGIQGIAQTQSNIDNTWLESMVDVGVIGLIPLAVFCISGIVRLLRSHDIRGDVRVWATGVVSYGLLISFVNPTIQGIGPSGLLLAFPLLAAVRAQPWKSNRDASSAA